MEKYIASCVVQLKKRRGKPFQARLRYADPSKTKGWSEMSKMVPEDITSKREASKWVERWRAEMNAIADNMPSISVSFGPVGLQISRHRRSCHVFLLQDARPSCKLAGSGISGR